RHSSHHNDCPIQSAELADPAGDYSVSVCCRQRRRCFGTNLRVTALRAFGPTSALRKCRRRMSGASRVAKAAPDGYQVLLGTTSTLAVNQTFYKRPLYNAVTDFAPVALIAESPIVLVARRDLPANNLQEFIAYAKVSQAKMQYGSAGSGLLGPS